jgi:ankyrin repeat protein
MDIRELPRHPSLEQYRKQAKGLLKNRRIGDPASLQLITQYHPRFLSLSAANAQSARFILADAQLVIARRHGFESWVKFARHIEAVRRERSALLAADPAAAFIEAACVPVDGYHIDGTLEGAEAILAKHPEIASASIYTAAILGDDAGVRRLLALDVKNATAKGGLHGWDALTYLCFSRYLRLDRARSASFVKTAKALLDAGAPANTGWYDNTGEPKRYFESAIYGAAGIAQHPEVTRLLLEHGADPNDEEAPYHIPESYDLTVMKIVVESGKLNDTGLTTMLLRKADWHDLKGIRYLLDHGADPNRMTIWKHTALHQALRRDNHLEIIEAMLDHGADPSLVNGRKGRTAASMAAYRGRGDVLDSLERRGISNRLQGAEQLIAACATNDGAAIASIIETEPHLLRELLAMGGTLLAEFAGNGNTDGVRRLLDLGVDVAEPYKEGDPYFEIAKDSTALHVAAWRARHATVNLLLERGAPVNARNARAQTPLDLAIRAYVDSHWKHGRTTESIESLLHAGASTTGVELPTSYPEADELIRQYRKPQA